MKPNGLPYTLLLSLFAFSAATPAAGKLEFERGRYLLITGGCNDCHTPGYIESEGKTPEPQWLTGSHVGFQGPWGTSYPVNLRLYVQTLSEAQWIARVRQPMRPPMPWFNLRESTDADLRTMYRYIRQLGPEGVPAPGPVAPSVAVTTPYIDFTPKNLPQQHALK